MSTIDCERPRITSLAPWFGSKRNLAPAIVEELGPHSCYWEPFCGSMAVLLFKTAVPMETVNDLHGDLINLGRVVQDRLLAPQLYRRARRVFGAKVFSDEAAARFRERGNAPSGRLADLDRAYDYLLSSWMGRNGVAGTPSYNQGFSRRFTVNGGHSGKRWRSVVESIPQWRRRMAQVTILSEDGVGLIERIEDHPSVAIYCDPPYLVKGAKYVYDFSGDDHRRLAESLQRFKKSRVVVSYYDHPDLKDLYPGWTQRKIEVSKAMASQGRRTANDVRAVEVLLLNGLSYHEEGNGRLF